MHVEGDQDNSIHRPTDPDGLVLEAWAQGFMVGGLLFMIAITIANMRRKALLHKLILLEVRPLLPSACILWRTTLM